MHRAVSVLKKLFCFRNKHFHHVDISHQSEWDGAGVTAAEAQLGLVRKGHRCWVSPSSIYEIAAFSPHKVWGQMEGWLREKDISCLLCGPLCEQREGSQLLLASSHCQCGQPDGFISASLPPFSQKLRGGKGFRSTSVPLPSWSSGSSRIIGITVLYGQRKMFYVVILLWAKWDGGRYSIATEAQLELEEALQAGLKLCQ